MAAQVEAFKGAALAGERRGQYRGIQTAREHEEHALGIATAGADGRRERPAQGIGSLVAIVSPMVVAAMVPRRPGLCHRDGAVADT